jgi:hypothetical protein
VAGVLDVLDQQAAVQFIVIDDKDVARARLHLVSWSPPRGRDRN